MKRRGEGHTETTISGDTRADWSDVFELVPSIQVAYVWHASIFTREVLIGLERIGFVYPQQIIWDKGKAALTRTHYWYQHEPCWYVRKPNAPWFGNAGENTTIWARRRYKMMMERKKNAEEDRSPTQERGADGPPDSGIYTIGDSGLGTVCSSGTTLAAAGLSPGVTRATGRRSIQKYVDVVVESAGEELAGGTAYHRGRRADHGRSSDKTDRRYVTAIRRCRCEIAQIRLLRAGHPTSRGLCQGLARTGARKDACCWTVS